MLNIFSAASKSGSFDLCTHILHQRQSVILDMCMSTLFITISCIGELVYFIQPASALLLLLLAFRSITLRFPSPKLPLIVDMAASCRHSISEPITSRQEYHHLERFLANTGAGFFFFPPVSIDRLRLLHPPQHPEPGTWFFFGTKQ